MSYTTTAKIRDNAWFANNTYVLDASIDIQRLRAFGMINSYVGIRYQIPNTGDTNFIGSSAALMLESIEITLGSGLLLKKEYGPEGKNSDKDGYRMIDDANDLLTDIRENKIALFLLDGTLIPSVLLSNSVAWKIRAFPNTDTDESFNRKFSVTDKF